MKTFGDSVVSSYRVEALNYFKKYVNKSYECILADCLQYSCTWDNYALSIMFLRILIGIHRSIDKKNKFIILFMKLLVNNIHLNPLKRFFVEIYVVKRLTKFFSENTSIGTYDRDRSLEKVKDSYA